MARELPTIDQTFVDVVLNDRIYVDKTEYISELIKDPQNYFLWRPRRFGKSLLLSAMAELFKGNRELFRGLWVYDNHKFEEYPVIHFHMSFFAAKSEGELEDSLIENLIDTGKHYNVPVNTNNMDTTFRSLVRGLSDKFKGERAKGLESDAKLLSDRYVVFLIDDYDAPILGHLVKNKEIADQHINMFQRFYRLFKNYNRYIYFSLMTGVSQVAISAMGLTGSSFYNLSYCPKFAGICGFTEAELIKHFGSRFPEVLDGLKSVGEMSPEATTDDLWKKILKWHDGYNFDDTPELIGASKPTVSLDSNPPSTTHVMVLNPFSISKLFDQNRFRKFWLASEPASFLGKLIAKDPEAFIAAQGSDYHEYDLSEFSWDSLDPAAILFQFGYLTIDTVKPGKQGKFRRFSLKIPSWEVATAYREAFLSNIFNINSEDEKDSLALKTRNALVSANSRDIGDLISTALAKLTYNQRVPNENHCHAALGLFFAGLEIDVRSDAFLSWSRPDLTLVLPGSVFACLELKYVPWPYEEQEKLSANLTKLIQFQLGDNPFTQDQLDHFRSIFPDISLLSLAQKESLSSTLARDQTLSNKKFLNLILKLQKDGASPKGQELKKIELAAHLEEELGPVARDALEQIVDKRYVHQYRDQAAAIVEVGVAIYGRDIVWAIARKIEAKDFAAVIEARDAAKIIQDRQTKKSK
ncbi:MAG: AAA family ATPase [Deltaproteobacteria bacterium]|jgi:hypothetical protein|nr:AAA family ATPase [Deltaproteobacteria bacterium]